MCNLCAQGLGVVVQVDSKEESRRKGQLWEQENGGLACPHVAHPPNPGMEELVGSQIKYRYQIDEQELAIRLRRSR